MDGYSELLIALWHQNIEIWELLAFCVIVVLNVLLHLSTYLGSLLFIQKNLSWFLCSSIFAVHTWQQQKTPIRVYWKVFLPRWLDSPLCFSWLLQLVPAWGKMAQKGEYFVTFLGKIFIKFDELTLSDWGVFETFWSASTSTQVAFTFFGWLLFVCSCIGKDGTKRWVFCDFCMKNV